MRHLVYFLSGLAVVIGAEAGNAQTEFGLAPSEKTIAMAFFTVKGSVPYQFQLGSVKIPAVRVRLGFTYYEACRGTATTVKFQGVETFGPAQLLPLGDKTNLKLSMAYAPTTAPCVDPVKEGFFDIDLKVPPAGTMTSVYLHISSDAAQITRVYKVTIDQALQAQVTKTLEYQFEDGVYKEWR